MKDTLLIGMALGFIAGAVLVTKNDTARQVVEKSAKNMEQQLEKGKKAVKKQVDKMK